MTAAAIEQVRAEVQEAQEYLRDRGWIVASNWGELTDPNQVVWFGAGYATNEYTVSASYRPRQSGKAEGMIRVRLTPTLVGNHPGVGVMLAEALAQVADELAHTVEIEGDDSARGYLENSDVWPPRRWSELTV